VLVVALTAAGCGEKTTPAAGAPGPLPARPRRSTNLAVKVPDAWNRWQDRDRDRRDHPPNEFPDTDGKTVIG
jgi:hypothetical protein